MKLSPSLREQLKIPLGVLLPDSQVDKPNILKHIAKYQYLISVGDKTTEKMIAFGLTPSLQIIDGYEKRKKRKLPKFDGPTRLTVSNPASTITAQSISAIKKAFTLQSPVRLYVDGEEDLLVLPVCIYAPENAVILYGQPNQGLVIVNLTADIRNKAQGLLDLME